MDKTTLPKISRRNLIASLGFGLGLPQFLTACGKKQVEKGVLRVALNGGPDSLDPMHAEYAIADLLFRQFLLPVVGYGDGGKPSNQFSIAQSWKPNSDFTKWVFKIKPNLKWSDGAPLGAKDVVESLQYSANSKTAYPNASELYNIQNYQNVNLKSADPKTIGVRQIAQDEVEINLQGPDAGFAGRMQEFYPVPLHAINKHGENWTNVDKIVVSGPFIPKIYTQTRLRFEKNLNGGWAAPMPLAIEVEAVDDAATRIRMFQSGDIDLAQDPSLLRYSILKEKQGDRFKRILAPRFIYMSLNTKRPQLANKDVRRALSMTFNRNIVSHNIFRDAVHPATRFLRDEPPIENDVAGAQAIMQKLGYSPSNLLKFELIVAKDDRERAAVMMATHWKKIWVEATINTVESSAISARLNGFDFDCAIVRVDKGMKSDPVDLMGSFATGGNAYSHQWKNAGFDEALEKVRGIGDPIKRHQALVAAEKFLLDEVPIMPIWFGDGAWLQSDKVKGGYQNMQPIIWPSLKMEG